MNVDSALILFFWVDFKIVVIQQKKLRKFRNSFLKRKKWKKKI